MFPLSTRVLLAAVGPELTLQLISPAISGVRPLVKQVLPYALHSSRQQSRSRPRRSR